MNKCAICKLFALQTETKSMEFNKYNCKSCENKVLEVMMFFN